MEYKGEDRRKSSRICFPCRIIISSPIRLLVSHTDNLSPDGMRVMLEEKLARYMVVGIEIYFEKERPIKCKGKIAWVKEVFNPLEKTPAMFDTGVEFSRIADCDKEYITKLIDSLSVEGESNDSGENK